MKKICISLISAFFMVLPNVAMAQGETEIKNNIEYVAEINNVKAINLVGSADLVYWQNFLSRENLTPYNNNGKAEIIVTGTNLSWMNIPFSELVVAITVGNKQGTSRNGYYLIQAFNSSGLLAFYERVLFSTPYYEANIKVQEKAPLSIDVVAENTSVFNLKVSKDDYFLGSNEQMLLNPIFLPRKSDDITDKLFYAKITGFTESYKFNKDKDLINLNPVKSTPAIKYLKESHFMPYAWQLMENAFHSKSKTYEK